MVGLGCEGHRLLNQQRLEPIRAFHRVLNPQEEVVLQTDGCFDVFGNGGL